METIQIIQIKQIIKIFLASSKELSNVRYAFGNFVRRLNKTYEKRGIRLDLFEWEDYDAAYNNRRKQDEYDDQIRDSDMFLALFRTWAGKFTIEEFDVAVEEFRRTGKKPKNYVYIRDLFEGETETDELIAFKRRLSDEMGYFWIRYNNNDSLQLHFVMQLQLVESNRFDSLKVENGEVKFGDMTIAQMDNLRFAASNEEYKRMNQRLAELPGLIEKARMHVENYPNEEDFKDELQELLNERNQLQKDFDEQQQLLLNTALRITRLQGERINVRMRRAIEAFEEGKVRESNVILNEAERDAKHNLSDYKKSKELTEQKRQNVIYSIEELLLKTSTLMADVSIPIDERIKQTKGLYEQADQLAIEVEYDKEKYSDLMFDYAKFLYDYGLYFDAEAIYLRQIKFAEELYGKKYEKIISSYNELGKVYRELAQHSKALEYYFKVLQFAENAQEKACNMLAITYRNIGLVYFDCGKYSKAMKYYLKALEIQQKIYGDNHIETASSYNNIGSVYRELGKNSIAIEYYNKALEIRNNNLNENSPLIANTYNNLGCAYYNLGEYVKAETYHLKALEIREKSLGTDHPYTGQTYNNLGTVYWSQKNYTKALTYFQNGLKVQEKTLGKSNPFVAIDYNNIGMVFREQSDYHSALDNFKKALEIEECIHRLEHPYTAVIYHNIGITYYYLQKYQQSLECLEKASIIRIKNPSSYYQHLQNTPEWISKVQNAIEENKTSDEPLRQNKTIENEYI